MIDFRTVTVSQEAALADIMKPGCNDVGSKAQQLINLKQLQLLLFCYGCEVDAATR
jgi:hypothetical protein